MRSPAGIVRRWAPVAVVLVLVLAVFASGLGDYLTLDTLRDNRRMLHDLVQTNLPVAVVAYVLTYLAVVISSLPGATIMTMAGGFLFGVAFGGTLTALTATVGSTAIFIIGRTTFGDSLRQRAGPFLRRMEDGFHANAFSYMLFLRLVPIFPFWVVTLGPALLRMKLATFVSATLIGIVPGTLVFSAFGAGLGRVFDAGGKVRMEEFLSPELVGGFVGLGLLSLAPIFFRKWRERRS